jgi:hypothetical protein
MREKLRRLAQKSWLDEQAASKEFPKYKLVKLIVNNA